MRWLPLVSLLGGLSCASIQSEPVRGDEATFEWVVLGHLGGDTDEHLSAFLLGRVAEKPTLLIDGGSLVEGIAEWQRHRGVLSANAGDATRAMSVKSVLSSVSHVLLTHAHLDHWGGLVQASTLLLSLVQAGHASFELAGFDATMTVVRGLFQSSLWADFTSIPPERPTFALHALAPRQHYEMGRYRVTALALNHTIESAGFLIEDGDAALLHLGDTGATSEVWEYVRPLLRARQLKGLAIEVSFAAAQESLARMTGHLTRSSLLLELAKLAEVTVDKTAAELSDGEARELARVLAPHFAHCPILIIHRKALAAQQIELELKALQDVGLRLELVESGRAYRL